MLRFIHDSAKTEEAIKSHECGITIVIIIGSLLKQIFESGPCLPDNIYTYDVTEGKTLALH